MTFIAKSYSLILGLKETFSCKANKLLFPVSSARRELYMQLKKITF